MTIETRLMELERIYPSPEGPVLWRWYLRGTDGAPGPTEDEREATQTRYRALGLIHHGIGIVEWRGSVAATVVQAQQGRSI